MLVGLWVALLACAHPAQPVASAVVQTGNAPSPNAEPSAPLCPNPATAPRDCIARNSLPDPRCTPGATATDDFEVLCHQPTAARRCNFSKATREAMFHAYGLPYPEPHGAHELDHLIPLELGGANTLDNVWPEAADPDPGFHQKDWLENYLHKQVCAGEMDLAIARWLIRRDWVNAYRRLSKSASEPVPGPVPALRGGRSDT